MTKRLFDDKSIAKDKQKTPRLNKSVNSTLNHVIGASKIKQRISEQPANHLFSCIGNKKVQRMVKLAGDGREKNKLDLDVEQAIRGARGHGRTLETDVQAQMENIIDSDFDDVRVHTDSQADCLNQKLSARAFTSGLDIFFSNGAYDPRSVVGRELLAHELVHVVQQTQGTVRATKQSEEEGVITDTRWEREADELGIKVAGEQTVGSGGIAVRRRMSVSPSVGTNTIVQRKRNLLNEQRSEDEDGVEHDISSRTTIIAGKIEDDLEQAEIVRAYIEITYIPALKQIISKTRVSLQNNIMREQRLRRILTLQEQKLAEAFRDLDELGPDTATDIANRYQKPHKTPGTDRYPPVYNAKDTSHILSQIKKNARRIDVVSGRIGYEMSSKRSVEDFSVDRTSSEEVRNAVDTGLTSTGFSITGESSVSRSVESADGEKIVNANELSTSVEVGSGLSIKSSIAEEREGKLEERETQATTGIDEQGRVQIGVTRSQRDAGGKTSEESRSLGISSEGIKFGRRTAWGRERTGKRGALTSGTEVSRDGTFKLIVVKRDDGKYEMVLTVSFGGDLSTSLGVSSKRKRGNLKVSAEITGMLQLEHGHIMEEEEAQAYFEDVEAIEARQKPKNQRPEFSMIERARALLVETTRGEVASPLAIVGSGAQAAETMKSGESYQLTIQGGVTGGVEAGVTGAGVSVGATASLGQNVRRTIKVTKSADDLVELTVTFVDDRSSEISGGAGLLGIERGVSKSESNTGGEGRTFLLNTKHDAYVDLYSRILSIPSSSILADLSSIPPLNKYVSKSRYIEGESESRSDTVEAFGGIRAAVERKGIYGSDLTVDQNGNIEGIISAVHSLGSGLRVAGIDLVSGEERHSLLAELDKGGVKEATLSTASRTQGVLAGGRRTKEEAGLWELVFGGTAGISDVLSHQRETISESKLGEGEVRELIERASDFENWQRCAFDKLYSYQAWNELGSQIRNSGPSPNFSTADTDVARQVTQMQAIAKFMKSNKDAYLLIDRALSHWGEDPTGRYVHGKAAKDLGTELYWPEELYETRERYEGIKTKIDSGALTLTVQQLEYEGFNWETGQKDANTYCNAMRRELEQIIEEVMAYDEFSRNRARVDMVAEFRRLIASLDEERLISGKSSDDFDQKSSDDLEQLSSGYLLAPEMYLEIDNLEQKLAHYKFEEQQILAGQGALYTTSAEAIRMQKALIDLFEKWRECVWSLRSLYQRANISGGQQLVSAGPELPRNLDYEPDVEKLINLHREVFGNDWIKENKWRSEWGNY